ncbi:MAG: FlgD immunoglobulin-like domain containing protein [Candidatus Eisenbacteria bacterium]
MRSRRVRWFGRMGKVIAMGALGFGSGEGADFRLEFDGGAPSGAAGETGRIGVLLRYEGEDRSPEGILTFERLSRTLPPWRASFPVPSLEAGSGLRAGTPFIFPWAFGDTIAASFRSIGGDGSDEVPPETLFVGSTGPVEEFERELPGPIPVDLRLAGGRAAVIRIDGATIHDLASEPGGEGRALPGSDLSLGESFALVQVGGEIERFDLEGGGMEVLSDPAFPCCLPAAGDSFSIWFRSCCGSYGEWMVRRHDGFRTTIPLGPASVGRPSVEGPRAAWLEHDLSGNRVLLADLVTGKADTLFEAPLPMDDPLLAGGRATGVVHGFSGSRVVAVKGSGPAADTLFTAEGAAIRSLSPAENLLFWLEEREKGWIVRGLRPDGRVLEVRPLAARRWSLRADEDLVLWIEQEGDRFFLRGFRFEPVRFAPERGPLPSPLRARIEAVRVGEDHVTIEWRIDGATEPIDFAVLRSGDTGSALREEEEVGRGSVPGAGYYTFVDRMLPSGEGRQRVRYSLRLEAEDGPLRIGPVAVLLPERFARIRVLAAGPNPARGTVRFALGVPPGPVSGRAGFRVYDGRGRLVRTVDLGPVRAGLMAVRWDGEDGSGRGAVPGVYFIRMIVGERFRETRKVVLLSP